MIKLHFSGRDYTVVAFLTDKLEFPQFRNKYDDGRFTVLLVIQPVMWWGKKAKTL